MTLQASHDTGAEEGSIIMDNRLIQILTLLNDSSDYVTTKQLALELDCSERTVRSDIGKLKEILQQHQCGTITAKTNKGYQLNMTQKQFQHLMHTICHKKSSIASIMRLDDEYTILETVLKTGSVKLAQMEYEMFTSKKNVAKSADLAQQWLESHGMSLCRKRGKGIQLEGTVHQARTGLWELFLEMEQLQFSQTEESIEVAQFWSNVDITVLQQCVYELEREYCFRLSYDGYRRFEFLLAAMVMDYQKNITYAPPKFPLVPRGWEYEAAVYCRSWLNKRLRMELPKNEVWFIWFALSSCEVMHFTTPDATARNLQEKKTLDTIVNTLIKMTGEILQLDFSHDEILKAGLLNYLSALWVNAHFGYLPKKEPPLLWHYQKERYSEILVACQATEHLLESKLETHLNESIIHSITSHFAGAAERNQVGANICVVCNYGVGISRLLCEQLKRELPGINIQDVLTPRDKRMLLSASDKCDFIITTVPLPKDLHCDVIRIGNHLRVDDISAIRKRLNKVTASSQTETYVVPKNAQLAEPSLIFFLNRAQSKASLLNMMCAQLEELGYVDEEFEATVFKREESSTTVLPGGVAIPHGFPANVKKPKIAVAILNQPLTWNPAEKVDMVFLLALSMEKEHGAKNSIIRFYKGLIALMDNPEEMTFFRSLSTPEQVADYINNQIINKT